MITVYEKKGMEKGMENMQLLILNQIKKKFGALSPNLKKHIKSIKNFSKLNQIGAELLDINDVEELKKRLR